MLNILCRSADDIDRGRRDRCALLAIWAFCSPIDQLGLISFLTRWLHVLACIIWVGMIWFVNFIQLIAVQETDDAGRAR